MKRSAIGWWLVALVTSSCARSVAPDPGPPCTLAADGSCVPLRDGATCCAVTADPPDYDRGCWGPPRSIGCYAARSAACEHRSPVASGCFVVTNDAGRVGCAFTANDWYPDVFESAETHRCNPADLDRCLGPNPVAPPRCP